MPVKNRSARGKNVTKKLGKTKATERKNSELVVAFTGLRSQGGVPVAKKSSPET